MSACVFQLWRFTQKRKNTRSTCGRLKINSTSSNTVPRTVMSEVYEVVNNGSNDIVAISVEYNVDATLLEYVVERYFDGICCYFSGIRCCCYVVES